MDAARQALRFSIPGSVLVLLTFSLILGELALQEVPPSEVTGAVQENIAALVGILSVIPIGFITYQIYYLGVRPLVWTRLWPWQRRRPRIDRGAGVLSVFSTAELEKIRRLYGLVEFGGEDDLRKKWWNTQKPSNEREFEELYECERTILDADIRGTISVSRQDRLDASNGPKWLIRWAGGKLGIRELAPEFIERWPFKDAPTPKEEWRQAAAFYKRRWRTNWDIVVALVEAAAEYPDTASIKAEYTILSDLYHALGACRTACSLAFALSTMTLILCVLIGDFDPWRMAVGIGLSFLLCSGLWLLLNHSRRQTWKAASKMMRHGFRRLMNRHPEFLTPVPIHRSSGKRRFWPARLRESIQLTFGV